MSLSDKPRTSRAPRKARPKISLKVQAIGFLSRREHSRQELRAKLLASLRKREREDAALAAAAQALAKEIAQVLDGQLSNGIDDAFAPPTLPRIEASVATPVATPMATSSTRAARSRASPRDSEPSRQAATSRTSPSVGRALPNKDAIPRSPSILDNLRFANGDPILERLRSNPAFKGALLLGDADAGTDNDGGDDRGEGDEAAGTGVDARSGADAETEVDPGHELERSDPEAAVDQLLDWLVANKYLSEARFIESRVNARSRKQGGMMIRHELSRHGLTMEPEQAAALRETEFARAQAIWQRKFGEVAVDARHRARQARFLAARGFAADIVRRIVGGEEEF
jgi:regulatory protein